MTIVDWIGYIIAAFGLGYALATRITRKEYEPLIDRLLTVAELLTAAGKEGQSDEGKKRN